MQIIIQFPEHIEDDAGQFQRINDIPSDMPLTLHCPLCGHLLNVTKRDLADVLLCRSCQCNIRCIFHNR